jgi:hypothetical protein
MIDDITQPDNTCLLRRAHSIHFGGLSNSPSTFNSLVLNDDDHCHHNYHSLLDKDVCDPNSDRAHSQ